MKGHSSRRAIDRIRAIATADIPAEQAVALQVCEIGRLMNVESPPAFYVLDSRNVPDRDFTVWLGSEMLTDELRMLLGAGVWPGPRHAPSPSQIVRDPSLDHVVAVTLWGTPEDGPWAAMWRERTIKYGLYGAFVSPRGRVGVMLTHRGENASAFSEEEVAFVKACAPYIEASLDRHFERRNAPLIAVETVHLRFRRDFRIEAYSLFGAEMMRDLAGGGPGASQTGAELVQAGIALMRAAPYLNAEQKAKLTLGGEPDERALREARADLVIRLAIDHQGPTPPVVLGTNGLGRFELWPTFMLSQTGETEIAASLTRYLSVLTLQLRGALHVEASAREMQLLSALDEQGTLAKAAEQLEITEGTARTLGKRLAERVDETGLRAGIEMLTSIGRTYWP